MEEIKESFRNSERIRKCPHFEYCGAVKCPMDELMRYRVKLSSDQEKCRLGKAKRMTLGSDMETKGLNTYEIAALLRTHGSLEKGLEAILNQNIRIKNKAKFSKRAVHTLKHKK
jgi:hypothetical protein